MEGRKLVDQIRLTCTDKGQHDEVAVVTFTRNEYGRWAPVDLERHRKRVTPPNRAAYNAEREETTVRERRDRSRDSWTFGCPRCSRTPRMQHDRLVTALDALSTNGRGSVDLSVLSF